MTPRHRAGAAPAPAPAPAAVPVAAAAGTTTARGTVLTADDWPLPGASVTVLGPAGDQLARAVSGADGSVELRDLPAGPATLLVAASSHEPQARPVLVPGEGEWSLGALRLRPAGAGQAPPPGRWTIDPAHSCVTATARHLGLSVVHGRFAAFSGTIVVDEVPERSTVEAVLEAASIDTGNAARDAHLRAADFLDVGRHPQIRFTGSRVERTGAGGWVLHGDLELLGVRRPVALDLRYGGTGRDLWGGTRAAFSATGRLDRDDFRMNWNQAVEVGVAVFGSTLKVAIDVEAVLEAG